MAVFLGPLTRHRQEYDRTDQAHLTLGDLDWFRMLWLQVSRWGCQLREYILHTQTGQMHTAPIYCKAQGLASSWHCAPYFFNHLMSQDGLSRTELSLLMLPSVLSAPHSLYVPEAAAVFKDHGIVVLTHWYLPFQYAAYLERSGILARRTSILLPAQTPARYQVEIGNCTATIGRPKSHFRPGRCWGFAAVRNSLFPEGKRGVRRR